MEKIMLPLNKMEKFLNQPTILEKPIFYEHCDMKGSSLSLDVGKYKLTKFMLPKKISSVKIPENYTVKLYDSNNNLLILNKSFNCLTDIKTNKKGDKTWNDRAVKIIIERASSIEKFNNLNTKNIIVIVILVILILIIIMLIIKKKFFS